jgi:hypothetical protein
VRAVLSNDASAALRLPRLPHRIALFPTMSELPADDHRPPFPPVRPGQDDCCQDSCDPCVFDLYEQAVERYHADLSACQKRNSAERKSALDRAAPDESA